MNDHVGYCMWNQDLYIYSWFIHSQIIMTDLVSHMYIYIYIYIFVLMIHMIMIIIHSCIYINMTHLVSHGVWMSRRSKRWKTSPPKIGRRRSPGAQVLSLVPGCLEQIVIQILDVDFCHVDVGYAWICLVHTSGIWDIFCGWMLDESVDESVDLHHPLGELGNIIDLNSWICPAI